MNLTLGSLLSESLDLLEALNILPDTTSEDEEGQTKGSEVNEEDHIPTNEEDEGGVDAMPDPGRARPREVSTQTMHSMQNRGMPYFEEMVENSRLGRIKRQRGGQTSQDGRMVVQWEVVEIGGDDEESTRMETDQDAGGGKASNKRQKLSE